MYAHSRTLAICAAVLASLWIAYGWTQNGRYKLERLGRPYVLDTRTGALYPLTTTDSGWASYHAGEVVEPPQPLTPDTFMEQRAKGK